MKTKIATFIFCLASVFASAEETLIYQPSIVPVTQLKTIDQSVAKRSFGYVRMGVNDKDAIHDVNVIPALGLGYRYSLDNSAVDMSANYSSQYVDKRFNDTYFYTVRSSYLRYVSNDFMPNSFYYGAGLAWGGLKKTLESTFTGFYPSATVGYEMNRDQAWHSFVQLDVIQPALNTHANWSRPFSFDNLPNTMAEVSVGFGY